jgi:hypothetical protein
MIGENSDALGCMQARPCRRASQKWDSDTYFYRIYAQPREKKIERIFRMSQINGDSRFSNLPFSIVESDVIDMVDSFEPDKSPDGTIDMVSLAGLFLDLTVFNATQFFQSPLIML